MTNRSTYVSAEISALPKILDELNATFESGKTLDIEWRKEQLRSLWRMLDENETAISDAIFADIGKPRVQIQVLEIGAEKNDILHFIAKMDEWLATETVETPPPFENWSPVIVRRPRGVCLVIGTWNYPITLTIGPMIGLIACGNVGILKPSEHAPQTAALLAELFLKYLDPDCFRIINGGVDVAQALLKYPYGHILYTGSTNVGKLVMKAAAEHLTPVTLELGGANSVIVTEKANVELAAKRIAWGKFAIAGQTCFAPNVAIVHESVYDAFIVALEKAHRDFYGEKVEIAKVGKIVNAIHWKRVMSLLSSTQGSTVFGGTGTEAELFIEPTVIKDVSSDDPLVQTEIFGPILPVLKYSTDIEAKQLLKKLSQDALALYVFTEDLEEARQVLTWCNAGTACINDVMGQIAPVSMPFGGVRGSGLGAYRGRASIDTFSHKQPMVTVPTVPEFEAILAWRYPQMESGETVAFVKANLEMKM
ncbi:related to Aldehyde dehydrogenase, dimeric NADP-preferring [Phialocephala subalpina]|uniref:Aldehyde dehydrogenase n=1 Tax=Phialocephala subalpina TaxID=576137 RepID=A0A1L7XQ46_9HELO|nr:related to Aldehyde dehydrogenase, dimeric NADP-preferring [Phialocephala subalpina]